MPTLDEVLRKQRGESLARPPLRVVKLPPSAWSDDREDKPTADVAIGIRLLSEDDVQIARSEAAKVAARFIADGGDAEDRNGAFNDALMACAVARGSSAADDVTEPFWAAGEDEVRARLTPEGIRRLYHEIEAMHAGENPAMPQADMEGLSHLVAMLGRGAAWAFLARPEEEYLRRLLELVRQELAAAEERAEASGHSVMADG